MGKPVAAICHGPQLLIETGMLKGRKMTSYPSVRTDIENAGAAWADKGSGGRSWIGHQPQPKDLPAFNKKMLEEIMEGATSMLKSPYRK